MIDFWKMVRLGAIAAGLGLFGSGVAVGLAAGAAIAAKADTPSAAAIEICSGRDRAARRVTCVHDGDTFWMDGTKYRLACIDAAELSEPRGLEARHFLARVLASPGAGFWRTGIADRHERQLVIVHLAQLPIDDMMVREGLARWGNYRNTARFCRRG